jgi:ATP-dependent Clp protease ATP-binding subunit ClpC
MLAQKSINNKSSNLLQGFAVELTATNSSDVFGRDSEIQRVIEILSRKNKANPVLVGDPGVGKTAIVSGLVKKIKERDVPLNLINKKVYSIDLSVLSKDLDAVRYVIDKVKESGDILFIDEIHNIVGAGRNHGSLDLANIMKPLLTEGSFMCIGSTTPSEFMKYFEKDSALERRFSKVFVDEPDFDSCLSIMKNSLPSYEAHHSVTVGEDVLKYCIEISKKYVTDKKLPDVAFDILDESCARKSLETSKYYSLLKDLERYESECDWEKVSEIKYDLLPKLEKKSNALKMEDVSETISLRTGIPANKINQSESKKLLDIEKNLKARIIGQDHALETVAYEIRSSRLGLKNKNSSFLFLGSSGVGKTETAKAIADIIFDDENALLRFDMSEFQEKHSISKLIGAPAGYVGYEEGGRLTEAVRQRPYQVILFDEVEKAHPDVYDTLLQVLDEGTLTDSMGHKVNFKNTIIIMTSNLKKEDIYNFFRTEFINRITDIINFNDLSRKDLEEITIQKLIALSEKVKKDNNIFVDFSKTIVAKIVDYVYKNSDSSKHGARILDKVIHDLILKNLSDKILKGELEENKNFLFN